jgi:ADP-ribose pyrophosphatase
MRGNKVNDELIHSSRLFEVRRLEIESADGRAVKRDMLVHPGAALILPVRDDGSIVLIRNYRFAVTETLWELPCGTLEPPEEPASCAVRELAEETGYTADSFEPICEFYSCPGYTTEKIFAFLATGLSEGMQELDETEDITVEIVPDAEVRRMVACGEITDSKTLATLGVYWSRKVN